jgi:hypothetical protein
MITPDTPNTPNTPNTTTAIPSRVNIAADGYEADLPFQGQQQPLILLQPLSPQVVAGDAVAGRFAGPLGDTQVMFAKFTFQPIGFELSHPEFAPDQKAPVFNHGRYLPRGANGAEFRRGGGGVERAGFYLPNGNQVVPTLTVFMLVDHEGRQYPSAFRFVRTGFAEGKRLGSHAAHLKAVIDGSMAYGCVVGRYEMTAVLEPRGYHRPKATLLGVVGEPGGPSTAQGRYGEQLRKAFKHGEDWIVIEAPALPAPAPVPAKPTLVRTEIEPPPASPDDYSGPASLDEILSDKVS